MIKRITASVTTDGSGDASASLEAVNGLIYQIMYVPDGTSPLDTVADLTIKENTTDLNVLTMANIGTVTFTRSPRILSANSADGVVGTNSDLIGVEGPLTLTIAQGGASKLGTFYVWFEV
jgi:hypothetical protein